MAHDVTGVIAAELGAEVKVTRILVPDPGLGEALVGGQACGVCHTDLHYSEGGIGADFPYLLGHEEYGVAEAVGPAVIVLPPGAVGVRRLTRVCGEGRARQWG